MKNIMILLMLFSGVVVANNSARDGFTPDNTPPSNTSFAGVTGEEFDDITTLPGDGWLDINESDSPNSDWFQGNDAVFSAQAGATTAYIAANFNSTAGSVICHYLVLPDLGFLQSVTFWTRTVTGNTFPDRMHVRHSPTGGTATGNCTGGFGDFTDSLLEINPNLDAGGYPDDWAEQVVPVGAEGRVALVYFVTDAGPVGNNSNYIGVDTLSYVAGPPPPPPVVPSMTFYGLLLMAALLMFLVRRRFAQ